MQLTPKQKLVLVWLLAIAIFWLVYLFLRHELVKPKKVYAIDVPVMAQRKPGTCNQILPLALNGASVQSLAGLDSEGS
jgi:hypothetical protein